MAFGQGLDGQYLYSPGYGFEFDGGTVWSMAGDTLGKGTYTVDGSRVRLCFGPMCKDMTLDGDCLIHEDGTRYCKE